MSEEDSNLSFIDIFLGMLLSPVKTVSELADNAKRSSYYLVSGFIMLVLVLTVDAVRLTPPNEFYWAFVNVPSELTGGLFLWLSIVSVVGLTAVCFHGRPEQVKASLAPFAWSYAPCIFLAPLSCLKTVLGATFVVVLALPFVWVLFLQLVTINQCYKMRPWQTLALVFVVPSLVCTVQFMQALQVLCATFGSLFS